MFRLLIITLLFVSTTQSEMCNGKVCINKCCETGFMTKRKICIPNNGTVADFKKISVHNASSYLDFTTIGNFEDFFELKPGYFGDEAARENSFLSDIYYSGFYIMRNGSVVLPIKNDNKSDVLDPDNYCIDVRSNKKAAVSVFFTNGNKNANPSFFKYGFLVSSIFLLLLLIVYWLVPELMNLGGMILMAYAVSLMFAFIFLFTLKMGSGSLAIPACKSLTHLSYFFLLASFCWMTVMSYDIWWTFRGYAKARPIHRRGASFKFGLYAAFAWGVPLGMTIALAILNEIDPKKLPGIIKPEIPQKGCFIDGQARLMYMYMPMLILIMCNWTFFGMTVFNIWRLGRGTNILSGGDSAASGTASAHRTQRHRFIVYLKLSVVMGLNWLLEVVSSFYPNSKVWYIFDIYNLIIGLVIFIIFVCKKKVLRKLKKRCCGGPSVPHSEPVTRKTYLYDSRDSSNASKAKDSTSFKPYSFHPVSQQVPVKQDPELQKTQWTLTRRLCP